MSKSYPRAYSRKPLRLIAFTQEDLRVISTMTQDAVFRCKEMNWSNKKRQFSILLNRYLWETTELKAAERVQSVLTFADVKNVQTSQIKRRDPNLVFSLLGISFKAEDDGMGCIELIMAGAGSIRLYVEALEAVLRDVTQPYLAPSGQTPQHR